MNSTVGIFLFLLINSSVQASLCTTYSQFKFNSTENSLDVCAAEKIITAPLKSIGAPACTQVGKISFGTDISVCNGSTEMGLQLSDLNSTCAVTSNKKLTFNKTTKSMEYCNSSGDLYRIDGWGDIPMTNGPPARFNPNYVKVGQSLFVFSGVSNGTYLNDSYRFNYTTHTWSTLSTVNAPIGRRYAAMASDGVYVFVWGGYINDSNTSTNTGAVYNLSNNTWTPITTVTAPASRAFAAAVETSNSKFIVWGGNGSTLINKSGGIYDVATNSWTTASTTNAPDYQAYPNGVWTGSHAYFWAGTNSQPAEGGRFNPATNTWEAMGTSGYAGTNCTDCVQWTGSKLVTFGGGCGTLSNRGYIFNPATDNWTAMTTLNAPSSRRWVNCAISQNGNRLYVWGGETAMGKTNTGAYFDLTTNQWTALPIPTSNTGRSHSHVDISSQNIFYIFGGFSAAETTTANDGVFFGTAD
jgi:N-acetylneuraminic acid mutarotase